MPYSHPIAITPASQHILNPMKKPFRFKEMVT
jgi:hypothetical protein